MLDLEFYIAHEKENPLKTFYYQPLKITTNTIIARILDNFEVDFNKEYKFYFTLDAINFAFVAQPIKRERENEVTFLVKESRIELRRYPRIKVEDPAVKVKVGHLEGYLADISLGGCKVNFENEIPATFYKTNPVKVLTFFIPNTKPITLSARIVNVQLGENAISFAFNAKDERVLKLYNSVISYLRSKEIEL